MWESRRSQILGSFLFVFLFFPIFLSISSRSSLLNREREKIWKDREKEIRKTNNKKDTTRKRKKTRDVWARWLYDSLGSCQRSLSHVVFLVSCLSSLSWSVINLFLSSISFSSMPSGERWSKIDKEIIIRKRNQKTREREVKSFVEISRLGIYFFTNLNDFSFSCSYSYRSASLACLLSFPSFPLLFLLMWPLRSAEKGEEGKEG